MTDTTSQTSPGRTKPGFDKSSSNHDPESKASQFSEAASETTAAAVEKAKKLADAAGFQAKEAQELLAARIKENPVSAVAIAFGAGVLFALLRK